MRSIRTLAVSFVLLAGFILQTAYGYQTKTSASSADRNDRQKKILSVEDIYSEPPLTGKLPSAVKWAPDGRAISLINKTKKDSVEQTILEMISVPSGKKRIVCIADTIAVPDDLKEKEGSKFSLGNYIWSKTGKMMAFTFKGEIFSLDPSSGKVIRLTQTEDKEKNLAFSPDGEFLSFTRRNDIFILNMEDMSEIRVTSTGCDTVLNGVLDWVYMEELFTRGNVKAYWWSPDSRKIAFLEMIESPVPEFPLVDYNPTHPSVKMQRYPKAGDGNPLVSVLVYNVQSGEINRIATTEGEDGYIARVHWAGDSNGLAIQVLNRSQDKLKLIMAHLPSGEVDEILSEEDSTWVNVTYMQHFYKKKPLFIWSSERNGFEHLYLYKKDGRLVRNLADGPWVVSELNDVDEERGKIYFTALEKNILERHLYRVSQGGRKAVRITKKPGTHRVKVSPNHLYYIDTFSNAESPPVISVHRINGRKVFTLASSNTDFLEDFVVPEREFFTFTSSEGITYNYSMIKPPGFDPAGKYPVIIYVYGGPHAQVVRDSWGGSRYLWHAMMASKGYIIFSMDNRGSYGRGKPWETAIAKKAGTVELHDQLEGVKYLKSLPFVDADRIGIWGWSYGGFMTCTALLKAPGVFKAGVSVAPVTDWRLYDTIYTERYMKRPDDNPEGYEATSLLQSADSLRAPLLLVHGMADDNVHVQNSIKLIKALVDAGKDFDLMFYPDKKHGIKGRKERTHLFKKITSFFEENL